MHLEIFSDTVCPWCYIGKRRLERALRARPMPDLAIRWRAFQLNPGMPSGGMDRRQYMAAKFGSAERAARLFDTVTRVGAEEGIRFSFDRITRTPNTMKSHRLLALAAQHGRQSQLLDRLFAAYFSDGRDIGQSGVLIEIGVESQLPSAEVEAALSEDSPIGTTLAEDFLARRQGINGVPYFVFNGRFGLSGAQEPEALYHMFDLAREDDALVLVRA
jgi:predicted DsbA family dithiol-disulfide isomerase